MKTFDKNKAIIAQKKYVTDNCLPHFAPLSGNCYACKKSIYDVQEIQYGDRKHSTGISVETASSSLITGCPHCCRSYCD